MKMKRLMMVISMVVAMVCAIVLAENEHHDGESISLKGRFEKKASSAGGTWAYEDGQIALVVASPDVCWVRIDGQWRIGSFSSRGEKSYFWMTVNGVKYVLCKPENWRLGKLRRIDFFVEEGCWYFGKAPVLFRERRPGEKLTDEKSDLEIQLKKINKISDDVIQDGVKFRPEDYVGIWKIGAWLPSGSYGDYMSIRKDGSGCGFDIKGGTSVPRCEFRWTAEMGGLRCMETGMDVYYSSEVRDAYHLWFDESKGCLVFSRWRKWGEMTRVEGMDDPALACRRMMQTRKYSGCWSGGEMFGAFTLMLDPDGNGLFTGGMSGGMVSWTADTNGTINLKIPLPYGVSTNYAVRYDPSTDMMWLPDRRFARRNVEVTHSHPAREAFAAFDKRHAEASAKRKKELEDHKNRYELKNGEQAFPDMTSMMVWLQDVPNEPETTRSAYVPTDETKLRDVVSYSSKTGWSAMLHTGYFERGERPSDEEIASQVWGFRPRPRELPPAQISDKKGWNEIVGICRDSGVKVSNMSKCISTRWWFSCFDVLSITLPKESEETFSKVLKPRFDGRFPCKAAVVTVKLKKESESSKNKNPISLSTKGDGK